MQASAVVVRGLRSCSSWTLEHRFSSCGTQAWLPSRKVGSFWTRDQTGISCIVRQILNNWTIREGPVVVQSLRRVRLFVTPWTAACQASHLAFTISWSLLKLMSIESVMPSTHLALYHPLLLLPSMFPSIRVFSNELALRIRWSKYWSFSFSISPSNEHSGPISFRIDWFNLLAVQGL